jgi:septal ring factor EnvC (AmiA/AmiB activator)
MRRYLSLIFILSLVSASGWGQTNIEKLEREIKDRKGRQEQLEQKAKSVSDEITELRASLRRLSQDLDQLTEQQNALETRLLELAQTEAALATELQSEQTSLVKTLAALQMLRKDPPPAFATHPDDALRAVQGAIALASIVPALQDRAENLRARLSELTAVRRRIDLDRAALEQAGAKAATTRDNIGKLLNQRRDTEQGLHGELAEESKAINKLVEQARNLRELSQKLAQRQRNAESGKKKADTTFSQARGLLPLPARGQITRYFGSADPSGEKSLGIGVATRAGSQIKTPFDGTILYAGPFRNYGQIVIIGIDSRYQILLAGLGEAHSFAGQDVLAGEPIGFMSEKGDANGYSPLYMEIRDQGKPIDPLPWIQAADRG